MLLVLCVVALSGCASSGPKYSELKSKLPALSPEQGRIFVYRKTTFGAAVQPAVKLNEQEVGKAVPKGFFYVDRPPGNQQISASTEVKRTLSLTLDKGQTRFVRLNVSWGFFVGHVYPELVESKLGEEEMADCHLLSPKPD